MHIKSSLISGLHQCQYQQPFPNNENRKRETGGYIFLDICNIKIQPNIVEFILFVCNDRIRWGNMN